MGEVLVTQRTQQTCMQFQQTSTAPEEASMRIEAARPCQPGRRTHELQCCVCHYSARPPVHKMVHKQQPTDNKLNAATTGRPPAN